MHGAVFGRRPKRRGPTERTHTHKQSLFFYGSCGTAPSEQEASEQEASVFLRWTNTQPLHNPAAGAKHVQETEGDSTVRRLPDSARAHASARVCACVRGLGRHCGSQLRWLGSARSIMEAEQRGLMEALESWERRLWSVMAGISGPTVFYWTGAASAL